MAGWRHGVGAVLALVAAPAAAAQRPIDVEVVVGWMLVLDAGAALTYRPAGLPMRAGPLDRPLHRTPTTATASRVLSLAAFERLAPVGPPILTFSPTDPEVRHATPIAAPGRVPPPREERSAVLALRAMPDPGRPPRPRASPFDVMLFLQIAGPDAVPTFGVRGGMAAIAWRAAMMGTGRTSLPVTISR